jgi:methyl-accepting chemotaxis protein
MLRTKANLLSGLRLRYQLSLTFSLLVLATITIISTTMYLQFRRHLLDSSKEQLKRLVTLAAMNIDGEAHATLRVAADEQSEQYLRIKKSMQAIRDSSQVRFLYTMRKSAADTIRFVVDAEEDSAEVSHLGDVYEDARPALLENMGSRTAAFTDANFYTDQWGTFLSGFAPLRTHDGRIDAFVGMDMSLASFNHACHTFLTILIVLDIIFLIPLSLLGLFLGHRLARPLVRATALLKHIADGDMSCQVSPELIDRRDEIGDLATSMKKMTESLSIIIGDLRTNIMTLAGSSAQLSKISGELTGGTSATTDRTGTVVQAAAQMSQNALSVAASMQQTSSNLSSVATAAEQMSSTIAEIATYAEQARGVSITATQQSAALGQTVKTLDAAAQEIGSVTETINQISAQTNLLALNATIEAARAGAAGKGFAVVANEVKNLANQTTEATTAIKQKIAVMQATTGGVIGDIEKISQIVTNISTFIASIAGAIETQATTTKEIAAKIAQASGGVSDVNDHLGQTATAAASVTQEITAVNQATGEMSVAAGYVSSSALELARMAEHLKAVVGKFTTSARQTTL